MEHETEHCDRDQQYGDQVLQSLTAHGIPSSGLGVHYVFLQLLSDAIPPSVVHTLSVQCQPVDIHLVDGASSLQTGKHLVQAVQVFEDLAGAAGHAGQGVIRDVHAHLGFFGQALVKTLQQRATPRQSRCPAP